MMKQRLEVLRIRAEASAGQSGKNPFSVLAGLVAKETGQSLSAAAESVSKALPEWYQRNCA